ncbi:MAG: hypothetical protein KAI24_17675, partial [Planctomycetes bacterium]|nr:hypothetical protein [Planctomycetota bacterium]
MIPSPTDVLLRICACLLLAAAPTYGQVRLGMAPPAPGPTDWLRGAPAADEPAPRCTLVAFYAQLPHLLVGDVAWLEATQRRFGDRGLRVVVVVADEATPGLDRVEVCSVVRDEGLLVERAWLRVPAVHHRNLVALDERGVVVFAGAPGCGVVDMVERQLAGELDVVAEERARTWRLQLVQGFDDLAGGPAAELLAPLVAGSPRDGLLAGLQYLTLATKANDLAAARTLRRAGLRAMAAEPRALAVFADLVLRG